MPGIGFGGDLNGLQHIGSIDIDGCDIIGLDDSRMLIGIG
jgi:hypothetical protein